MKMPTLLATANQKLRVFVRRRAFSERSRWLAEESYDDSFDLPVYKGALPSAVLSCIFYGYLSCLTHKLRTDLFLYEKQQQSGSFSRIPKAASLVVLKGKPCASRIHAGNP